ncbi:hypothetical protein L2E82_25278 [Cichorium intybus]|uniref:Uncharacterized protein n=1 Tax=Cichorium intybus TaxID=13427 RepID=A0ACB9E369_CICIN|nr:hypothetical protein L2E82_25278 [Cichorium intybus]
MGSQGRMGSLVLATSLSHSGSKPKLASNVSSSESKLKEDTHLEFESDTTSNSWCAALLTQKSAVMSLKSISRASLDKSCSNLNPIAAIQLKMKSRKRSLDSLTAI